MSRSISRRHFLADSLLGATAVASAAYAASAATTAVAQAPARPVSANDRLGVCVIGAGGQAQAHINNYRGDARCVILYVVDPDTHARRMTDENMDEIAATQGGIRPQRIADMRRAFDDPAVDLVSSATQNHWHGLSSLWAVQAGKHVYVEKPGNHNVHEGWALEAASKKYNCIVQIGTQMRSMSANIELMRFLHAGGIGEVNFARGICYRRRRSIGALGNFPIPLTVDYCLWSGPAPVRSITRPQFHYDWHWQRLYGNGDLGNQGSHQTDIARWALGLERLPQAVVSYGGRLGYDIETGDPDFVDAGDVANTCVSVYDYGDKCIVFETLNLNTVPRRLPVGENPDGTLVGVIVHGSNGYAIQGPRETGQTYSLCRAYDLEGNMTREFEGGGNHFRNFVDAVVAGDHSRATTNAKDGTLSAAISHFGNISYYLGEENKASPAEIKAALRGIRSLDDNDATVDYVVDYLKTNRVDIDRTPMSLGPILNFDLATNRFVGNESAAANEMLTREYRAPYIVPNPEDV